MIKKILVVILLIAILIIGVFMVKKYRTQGDKRNEVPGIDMGLLPGYKVEKTEGPDFNVYYVYKPNSDGKGTVAKMGIYFGGHPGMFHEDEEVDEKKIRKENAIIDGEKVTWYMWENKSWKYCREAVLRDTPNFPDFPGKVHIFIFTKTQEEMDLLKKVAEKFSS